MIYYYSIFQTFQLADKGCHPAVPGEEGDDFMKNCKITFKKNYSCQLQLTAMHLWKVSWKLEFESWKFYGQKLEAGSGS